MKIKAGLGALVLMMATLAGAQVAKPPSPPVFPPSGLPMMQAPPVLAGEWWKYPDVAAELRLSDSQKKQLDQISLNTKLALIDAGANGLKSFVRVQALLDAEPVDEPAYNQQVEQISAAAAALVKDVGQMALAVRKVLTADQWRKLEAARAERRLHSRGTDTTHPARSPEPPRQPSGPPPQ